jgi:hypothetical protein
MYYNIVPLSFFPFIEASSRLAVSPEKLSQRSRVDCHYSKPQTPLVEEHSRPPVSRVPRHLSPHFLLKHQLLVVEAPTLRPLSVDFRLALVTGSYPLTSEDSKLVIRCKIQLQMKKSTRLLLLKT